MERWKRWKDGKMEGWEERKDMNFLFSPSITPFHIINLFNLFNFS